MPRRSSASTRTTSPTRGTPHCASMVAFTVGALLPLLAITLSPARRAGVGHRCDGGGRPGGRRLAAGPVRVWPLGPSGGAQRRWRAVRDGDHLRRRSGARHRTSDAPRRRMFVAVVPPPEVVEHLDEFLDVRRAAAAYRWAPRRAAARHAGLPRRRAGAEARRPGRAAGSRRGAATAFEAAVAGGGAFPNVARARVLWAGARPRRRRPDRAVPDGDRGPGRGEPGRRRRSTGSGSAPT